MSDPTATAEQLAAAIALHQKGDRAGAETHYREILVREPANAEALNLLGVVHLQTSRYEEAAALIEQAIAANGEKADYHSNLAVALRELGRHGDSLAAAIRALELREAFPGAHANRGLALMALARYEDAALAFARAIELQPGVPGFHNSLGNARRACGDLAEAEAAYRRAVELQPNHAHALFGLGVALDEQGRRPEALVALQRAIALDDRFGEAHRRMGDIYTQSGLQVEAAACFARALALDPEDLSTLIANASMLNYLDDARPEAVLERAQAFSDRLIARAGPPPVHGNSPDPERRLRVGFMSGDLGAHAVGEFTRGVLGALDREQLELYCYCSLKLREPMHEQFHQWHYVDRLKGEQVAAMIIGDRIDILLDLSGFTKGGRPEVFAARPAPVQAAWLGYSGTTGNARTDYIVADRYVIPPAEEAYYSERPWRLPDSYLCWTPPAVEAPVAPLPALAAGHVTFGSFNNVRKLTATTVRTWAGVLRAVPTSQLVIKSSGNVDQVAYTNVVDTIAAEGVDPGRVAFIETVPDKAAHYRHYNRVDIALDPFPYAGTTTTVEALWMGVPVVTLTGNRFIARVGQSILQTLGEPDWIAPDAQSYIEAAAALAGDLPRLAAIRANLRPRLLTSPLCDAPRFARHFEQMLREMWRQWCATRADAP